MSDDKITAVEKLDLAIADVIDPALDQSAVKSVASIGKVADEPPLFIVSGALLAVGLLTRNRQIARSATSMMIAHSVAIAIKSLGKDQIDRTRPIEMKEDGRDYRMEPSQPGSKGLRSFPSGHAAGAAALAGAFGRHFPQHRAKAYTVAASLGIMQIARRNHFTTDVAAGLLVGAFAEIVEHRLLSGLDALWAAKPGNDQKNAPRLNEPERSLELV